MEKQLDYEQVEKMLKYLNLKPHEEWKGHPLYIFSLDDLDNLEKERCPLDYEIDDNGQLHLFLKDGTLIIDLATYKKLQKEVKKK